MANMEIKNKRLEHIYRLIDVTNKNLESIKEELRNLDRDDRKDEYKDVPGITGIFDGVYLVTAEGQKLEVPANYAAKSRLVFGDTLKLIDEGDKQVYKQIEKVARKKVEGILSKKEGKWYIISDSGTFKISDSAADFQTAQLNDEAAAFVPADNNNAPFAALDKVVKKPLVEAKPTEPAKPTPIKVEPAVKPRPVQSAPQERRPDRRDFGRARSSSSSSRPTSSPRQGDRDGSNDRSRSRPSRPRNDRPREYVNDIVAGGYNKDAPKAGFTPKPSAPLDEDDLR